MEQGDFWEPGQFGDLLTRHRPRDQQITHHIIQSLFPNWVGQQQQRFVTFEDEKLILSTTPFAFPDGAVRQGRLIWKRMENATKLDAAQLPSAL